MTNSQHIDPEASRPPGPGNRICENPACGKSFTPRREHGRFCSDDCRYEAWDRKHPRQRPDIRTTGEAHPLQAGRDEQAERKPTGECHADDLEGLYPADESEHARCRKLAGAQFGSLASPTGGGPLIREKERRKSNVSERKGAKSTVWEFTKAGWDRYASAGISAGESLHKPSKGALGGAPAGASTDSGTSQPGGDALSSPAAPPGEVPGVGESLTLLPEPDPEAWAA